MRISQGSPWTALPNVPAMAGTTGKGGEFALTALPQTGHAVPTIIRLKLRSHRDSKGSRIGQERVDLVVLERRIEGNLVIAFIREVSAPDFGRPFAVR